MPCTKARPKNRLRNSSIVALPWLRTYSHQNKSYFFVFSVKLQKFLLLNLRFICRRNNDFFWGHYWYACLCVISGFRRDVHEICALLGCYAALSGISVPTFRENLSGPIFKGREVKTKSWDSWSLKMGQIDCPETSVQNYHSILRNIQKKKERRSRACLSFCIRKLIQTYIAVLITFCEKHNVINVYFVCVISKRWKINKKCKWGIVPFSLRNHLHGFKQNLFCDSEIKLNFNICT